MTADKRLYKDNENINQRDLDVQLQNLSELAEIVMKSAPCSEERKKYLKIDIWNQKDKDHNPNHRKCDYKNGTDSEKKTEKRICRCMYYYNNGNPEQRAACEGCQMEWKSRTNVSNYRILDYEVPMPKVTTNVGGIDLLLQDMNNPDTVYATEVKPDDSNETLARMIAETLTYCEITGYRIKNNGKELTVKPAICFFEGSKQFDDFFEMKDEAAVQKLLAEVKVFYISCTDNTFTFHDDIAGNPFIYREDLRQHLTGCGLNDEEAIELSERVRKGKLHGKEYSNPLISKEVTDWFGKVTYLPSREREKLMDKMKKATPKEKFDLIIKQNLIYSGKADDNWEDFGYEINDRTYDEYYREEHFRAFVQEMREVYPQHYRKFAGDDAVTENKGGAGGELEIRKGAHGFAPPKMASVASSSRFCYLALRDGTDALDHDRVFTKEDIEFEKECRIFDRGHAPQLDAYIQAGDMNIYVEVKCHEIFDRHKPTFKNKYWQYFKDNDALAVAALPADEHKKTFTVPFERFGLPADTAATMFDIKQLVCHLLGIARQNQGQKAKLIYLFFKPKCGDEERQAFVDEVFAGLQREINAIFSTGLIPAFCHANNIELEAIAEESDIMCQLDKGNVVKLSALY